MYPSSSIKFIYPNGSKFLRSELPSTVTIEGETINLSVNSKLVNGNPILMDRTSAYLPS
jgi:hypothetical protein